MSLRDAIPTGNYQRGHFRLRHTCDNLKRKIIINFSAWHISACDTCETILWHLFQHQRIQIPSATRLVLMVRSSRNVGKFFLSRKPLSSAKAPCRERNFILLFSARRHFVPNNVASLGNQHVHCGKVCRLVFVNHMFSIIKLFTLIL